MKDQQLSGLTSRFRLNSVDDVQATITLTASVSFWKEAAEHIQGEGFGAWQVKAAIKELVRQAEASFYHRISEDAKL